MAVKPATALPVHRLDVDTYNQVVASGALEGQHVELLEGIVADMSPHSPDHAVTVEMLTRHFAHARARLRVQLPIEVLPDSEPEPDLALVAEKPIAGRHPRSALIVVEIAVSSHSIDRGLKAKLYARAGVPVYWLVDVPGRAVEVRTQPRDDDYRRCEIFGVGDLVPSPAQGVASLDLAELFDGLGDTDARSTRPER